MIDIDIDEEVVEVEEQQVDDEKKTAVQMAFIGAGQAGGNLANAFWKLGYRRVAVINTTEKDMRRLEIPEANRLVMNSPGGAGKNPSVGKKCAQAEEDNIRQLVQRTVKKGCDHIMLCIGAGGGTGTGSVEVMINVAKEYLAQNLVQDVDKKVGVIVTLPTKDESPAVQKNAVEALESLLDLAESGKLSPLVLVDNARAIKMYGGASIVDVFGKVNKNVAALFSVFNELAALDDESVHQTFDPEDYKSVLAGGTLVFGRTKLDQVGDPDAVSNAIRNNLKKGLLVEGLDISRATVGGGILVSNADGLGSITTESLEEAFRTLNSLMHKGPETKLHRGIYEAGAAGIHLYTILSGLGRPAERLAEMKAKAGGGYPLS